MVEIIPDMGETSQMSDFGHFHGHVGSMHIDAWGAGPYEIEIDGKRFRFEDSDRFGPQRLKRNGDPTDSNFGERSKFWEAHALWVAQGRRVADDGVTCLWRKALPTIVQKIGNMHMVLQHGEPNARGGIAIVQVESPKPLKPKA